MCKRPYLNLLAIFLITTGKVAAQQSYCSAVFALSGGSNPSANHHRYYDNIERVHDVFQGCPISNYMASGKDDDKVTMIYDTIHPKTGHKLKIRLDKKGLPILGSRPIVGGLKGGASENDLREGIREWSQKNPIEAKVSDRPVIVYVTDHGTQISGKGAISLWNKTHLTPQQLNQVINNLPQDKKVIMLFDQCYGGEMLKAMWNSDGSVRKNTCGISAAAPGQLAFSGGGAMRNLQSLVHRKRKQMENPEDQDQKMRRKNFDYSFKDVYNKMEADPSINSIPTLSSDLYANEWFEKKYAFDFETNLTNKNLVNPKFLCLKLLNFHQTGDAQADLSFMPPALQRKLQGQWSELHAECRNALDTINLNDLNEEIKVKEAVFAESSKAINDFTLSTYNPHILELIKDKFSHSKEFFKLKEKQNKNISLTPEERNRFNAELFELELYKAGIKDEAQLQRNGIQANYVLSLSEQTKDNVTEFNRLQSQKSDDWNALYRLKSKVSKLTTFNALDKMVKAHDLESIETYLNIVDCEKTRIFTDKRQR